MKTARDENCKEKKLSITLKRGGGNYVTRFDIKEEGNSTDGQKWAPVI